LAAQHAVSAHPTSLRSDMVQLAVCCFLLAVARVQAQRQVFRTELFPEQLQQQQVQFMQRQIQEHLQLLQTQAQAATTFEQQVGWFVSLYLCLCVFLVTAGLDWLLIWPEDDTYCLQACS